MLATHLFKPKKFFLFYFRLLFILCSVKYVISQVTSHMFHQESDEKVRSTVLKERIRYLLYDRSLKNWIQVPRNGSVPTGTWIPYGKVKMVIHGYSMTTWKQSFQVLDEEGLLDIGEAYGNLKNSSINSIVVDWTSLSYSYVFSYPMQLNSVKYAGLDFAQFLLKLGKRNLIKSLDDIHLIGLSIGAPAAGVAGYQIQKLTRGLKIGRITGIDPVGPLFDRFGGRMPKDTTNFLDRSDAKFVDIIHCNMLGKGRHGTWKEAILAHGRYGSFVQAGHADFYPDGGETQRGCDKYQDLMACSHSTCPKYYALSINTDLLACPCSDWDNFIEGKCPCDKSKGGVLMGSRCNTSARGRYYLNLTVSSEYIIFAK